MIRLLLTTFANPEDAARIVRTLVEEKLAACGTILPAVRSIYHWNDKIEDSPETCVLLKTALERYAALETRLQEIHPYENPEIIAIDPDAVSDKYAHWVMTICRP
jgi:periplasmic divalent cation tolerance protein